MTLCMQCITNAFNQGCVAVPEEDDGDSDHNEDNREIVIK